MNPHQQYTSRSRPVEVIDIPRQRRRMTGVLEGASRDALTLGPGLFGFRGRSLAKSAALPRGFRNDATFVVASVM
jgi:hypothetical protein